VVGAFAARGFTCLLRLVPHPEEQREARRVFDPPDVQAAIEEHAYDDESGHVRAIDGLGDVRAERSTLQLTIDPALPCSQEWHEHDRRSSDAEAERSLFGFDVPKDSDNRRGGDVDAPIRTGNAAFRVASRRMV